MPLGSTASGEKCGKLSTWSIGRTDECGNQTIDPVEKIDLHYSRVTEGKDKKESIFGSSRGTSLIPLVGLRLKRQMLRKPWEISA